MMFGGNTGEGIQASKGMVRNRHKPIMKVAAETTRLLPPWRCIVGEYGNSAVWSNTSEKPHEMHSTAYSRLTARKLPSKPNLPLPAKLPDSTMP